MGSLISICAGSTLWPVLCSSRSSSSRTSSTRRPPIAQRYVDFLRLWNEALFHDTQFTGLDLASNQEATRRSAQDALGLYAVAGSGGTWALAPLPPSLSVREQGDVAEGCYELLLTLAEAEPTPAAGLRRLDQAARLRPPTRAYHLRRAACLTRAGDAPAAEQERHLAEALKPITAFDHFLVGQERYKRRDLATAIQSFSTALQLRTDHFWAQCLWATSCLQLNQPSDAKSGLNACILREPGFAWLYLLRGFASYQLAVRAGDLIEKLPSQASTLRAEAEFQCNAAAADYRRTSELLKEKPNDELRYALYVNRGLLGLEHGISRMRRRTWRRRSGSTSGESRRMPRWRWSTRSRISPTTRPSSTAGQSPCDQSQRPCIATERKWILPGQTRPRPSGRRPCAILSRRSSWRSRTTRCWPRTTPIGAGCWLLDHRDAEALAACDAALGVVPDYDEAHRLRIDLLLKLKRYDEVIRSCDALIARGKATSAIYELRGLARSELKDFPGAIEDVTNAMALRPDRAALLSPPGLAVHRLGRARLAFHDFEAAIQLDPSIGRRLQRPWFRPSAPG